MVLPTITVLACAAFKIFLYKSVYQSYKDGRDYDKERQAWLDHTSNLKY